MVAHSTRHQVKNLRCHRDLHYLPLRGVNLKRLRLLESNRKVRDGVVDGATTW